jgi:hypothetical protein
MLSLQSILNLRQILGGQVREQGLGDGAAANLGTRNKSARG